MKSYSRATVQLFLVSVIVSSSAVSCSAPRSVDATEMAPGSVTRNDQVSDYHKGLMSKVNDVRVLMEEEEYQDAEELIDEEIDNPDYGILMHDLKAEVLVKLMEDEAALAKYINLLDQDYGTWNPQPFELRVPFDLAVEQSNSAALDQIATAILARNTEEFSEHECLNVPTSASSASDRLAYAYLIMAMNAAAKSEKAATVAYCLSAKSLRPNDPVVMIHLAVAYRDRGNSGDRDLSKAQFSAAWNAVSQNSPIRTAAQDFAYLFGMGQLP